MRGNDSESPLCLSYETKQTNSLAMVVSCFPFYETQNHNQLVDVQSRDKKILQFWWLFEDTTTAQIQQFQDSLRIEKKCLPCLVDAFVQGVAEHQV